MRVNGLPIFHGSEQTNGKKEYLCFRCILTPKSSKLIEVEMIDELFSFSVEAFHKCHGNVDQFALVT